MKGKIAFVIGAAVGYVLGTRAGRERYEQIKKGAQSVWNTPPVQRGVGAVKGAVQSKVDDLKASVVRASKDAFVSFTREPQPGAAGEANGSVDQGQTPHQAGQSSDRAS
jgi:hypothetical protein